MGNGGRYWDEQRNKRTFEEAAQDAKRELYPELFFSDFEPSVTLCRVCGGDGFHKPECKLRSPDGKAKPLVEDLLEAAGDKDKEKKPLIEVERERLKALDITPAKAAKAAAIEPTKPT
jgi:hypothetical protein